MRYSDSSPKVNAGSMADIAFLLLIFFLVTTTMSKDVGISRTLPEECPPNVNCSDAVSERNILRVILNQNQELMVDDMPIAISELKTITKNFIDNNGDGSCNYCTGSKNATLSDHPRKAIISLETSRNTNYVLFIKVQDEISIAYYELRLNYSKTKFQKPLDDLTKSEIDTLVNAYPFVLAESETK